MRRRQVHATLAAIRSLLVALALTASLVPVGLASTRTAAAAADYAAQVHLGVNAARDAQHLRPLRVDACLRRIAQTQALRMADASRISHSPRFSRIGSRCGMSSWGENVAQALGDDHGRGVVRQWLASPDHRTNMLRPGYRRVGTGAVHRHGSWWVVQVFGRRV